MLASTVKCIALEFSGDGSPIWRYNYTSRAAADQAVQEMQAAHPGRTYKITEVGE